MAVVAFGLYVQKYTHTLIWLNCEPCLLRMQMPWHVSRCQYYWWMYIALCIYVVAEARLFSPQKYVHSALMGTVGMLQ